jgi:tetratricopeptide (TPR) repeat protein
MKDFNSGSYNNALNNFNSALKLEENFSEAYLMRGQTKLALKDFHGAITDCKNAKSIAPHLQQPNYLIAQAYIYLEDYNIAISYLDSLIDKEPTFSQAHFLRGFAKHSLDDFNGSIPDFSVAIEQEPQNAVAYQLRASSYFMLENYSNAILDYNICIHLNPNKLMAYIGRGQTFFKLKDFEKGLLDFNNAIRIDSNYDLTYGLRGRTKLELVDYAGAIEDFNKAISKSKGLDASTCYLLRGIAKHKTQNYKGAISDIEKSFENNTKNEEFLELLKKYGISDIAINIPTTSKINEKTFALIIANENYTNSINAEYAINDGRLFNLYCEKTLGIPKDNIRYIENATYGSMRSSINWLSNIQRVFESEAGIIFYYAGHGMPSDANQFPYVLPVDGEPSDIETALKLEEIYEKLSEYSSKFVLVFIDACFSGAVRDNSMLVQARAVRFRPRQIPITGNMIVLTASTGIETAFHYTDKQHGIFTYYLLKKIQENKGNVSLSELSQYVIENVKKQSVIVNNKPQTPQLIISHDFVSKWESINLSD